jgi:hypothetical protein
MDEKTTANSALAHMAGRSISNQLQIANRLQFRRDEQSQANELNLYISKSLGIGSGRDVQ